MENQNKELLKVEHLKKYFNTPGGVLHAVDDVSFSIRAGETLGVVGESGCGKSTMGRAILRLHEPTSGKVYFEGNDILSYDKNKMKELRREMQIIFQDPFASLNPRMTVSEAIMEPLLIQKIYAKKDKEGLRKRVHELMNLVGLAERLTNSYPHELDGGRRQRIGIARAMVMEPELVVADEPISALDVSIRAQVLNLMKKFQKEKDVTYLFIAHDLSIVRFISDRIGVIYKGRIVEVADAEELFEYPLHPYTHSLISAIPIPDPKLEKNKVLFTYDPSMHDYSEDKPEFVNIGHDHWVYGNKKEIEEYKKVREAGIPVKSIQILDENTSRDEVEKKQNEAIDQIISDEFLKAPVHDTGNPWYGVLAFFLPIIGIIAALILNKHNYIRNYKVLKKGAIAGFIVIAVLILLLILAIVLAVI